MPVHNSEIAEAFDRIADLLEIEGANRFRVRAYRNAAMTLRSETRSMADLVARGADLSKLPTIGDDLAAKIAEFVRSGRIRLLEQLRGELPEGLVEVTAIPGIGPKRTRALYEALDIRSRDDLRRAAEAGRIAALPGFGDKSETKIRAELAHADLAEHRLRIDTAEDFAAPLLAFVRALPGVTAAEIAGSFRRRRETVGDLDIVAAAAEGAPVTAGFVRYDEVARVVSQGATRVTVILRAGLQVDLRVVAPESWGAALFYFTGSKAHNIACRKRAIARGLKLNEYGLFSGKSSVAGKTEADVYAAIGLPYILPELREDRGEIAAAEAGRLPDLIAPGDIRGDLHAHTEASDGHDTLADMAAAAQARGYGYLAITDHSPSARVAHGLDARRLAVQRDEIDRLNAGFKGFRLLKSSEVDILEDGRLDFPDAVLAELDLVVAAVHSGFNLSEAAQTGRLLKAMDNRHVSILAHPTGRLINERRAYAVDFERLARGAAERGCALELNANPLRLDLDDRQCRIARDAGVKIAISTDAHSVAGLEVMRFGIDQARRGWLEAGDVLNTRDWPALEPLLRRA
ncbi:DNA polymerase/3'-5' exonuclease PolX [Acidimangrovimonas pyrenivorans]|uniref:DNA polymerase beta n=1 Tax=Acidimangrovimonas pyrenivorans TaxID=2030798 RepID=A0ABV7AFW7_9RHOB